MIQIKILTWHKVQNHLLVTEILTTLSCIWVRYNLERTLCRSFLNFLLVVLLDCWLTSIISMVLTVKDISTLIYLYLLASGPTTLRWGGRLLPALLLSSQLRPARRTLGSLWIVLRLSLPVVPIDVICRHTDCEQNPRTPTSIGNSHVCQSLCLHWLSSSVHFPFFLS
jgi:hypothetical protein